VLAAVTNSSPTSNPVTSFSDSSANAYGPPVFLGSAINGAGIWYAMATGATGGAAQTVSVTTASSAPLITIVAAAYNITTVGVPSTSGALATGTGTGLQSPAAGQVGFASLVIGFGSCTRMAGSGASTWAPGIGFTAASVANGAIQGLCLEHAIYSTSGTYAAPMVVTPPSYWAALTLAIPDLSQPARSSQTVGALALGASGGPIPIPGIPPNMSVLAAMSAGLLPANVVVTGGSALASSPALTLAAQLSSIGVFNPASSALTQPASQLAASAATLLQLGTPPVFGG
jgi:hypothetical protein